MEKQKQIEEMARELQPYAMFGNVEIYEACDTLYNADYRKIPKNAVVLTREEYDVLKVKEKEKHWLETCMTIWKNAKIDARKETAEKFADRLKEIADRKLELYGVRIVDLDDIDEILKEITEKK